MIAVRSVTKRFGKLVALEDVSLALEAGRTTALIGPSGCGKSTLLRLMIGLIRPDAGEIDFDGMVLGERNLGEVRRRMGYAIQSGGLFPHLTCAQNVSLPARRHGMGASACRARVDELAGVMLLERGQLGRYPAELSGGQRQRVALMRALVLDPEVLLLDEPLGALDPMIRGELQHEFRELFERLGKTVVLVTHDLAEAAYLAPEDIVLMRAGRIEQRGSFAGMRAAPADEFVRAFIAAQMERVAGLVGNTG
jgi:osmoprotectant transport system ATP-binding protein